MVQNDNRPNGIAVNGNGHVNGFFHKLSIRSDPAEVANVQQEVEAALKKHEYDEKELFTIRLALEEALVNAIKHGNKLDKTKSVRIAYRIDDVRMEVHVEDEGRGYMPDDIPNPLAPENLERDCGRGLMLMRHYMTDVQVHAPGNRVSLVKVRAAG